MQIQGLAPRGMSGLSAGWSKSGKVAPSVCIVLLAFLLNGCTHPSGREPITLTFVDLQWASKQHVEEYKQELQQFTRETGIQINFPPSPESTLEQLALRQELLKTGASGPDVYTIDIIWPGILSEYFVDLKPSFTEEVARDFPAVVASYTVDKRLVAMPYRVNVGLLYYRTDLLRQYGYRVPPRTWDELETMAARIQAGERAKGKKDFWGFVWQGAAVEALTCNALEWQAAEGAGRIIEENKTISVNNPQTIRAWQRASRWVGSISPPSVVAYREWDAQNVWVAGNAAFMRNWTIVYPASKATESPIRDKFDVTLLPRGKANGAGTLGGSGLAVSRSSAHPSEALELVRYLTSRDVQVRRSRALSGPTIEPELHQLPGIPETSFALLGQAIKTGVVSRPSNVTGKKYEEVSNAYAQAVHSVLTGKNSAPEAAAALEKELVRMTGFKTGPPEERPALEGKF
jgi:trehalose/maltose transport system substrate-binding protein